MTRLLVTGGRQRQAVHLGPMKEWTLYDLALLAELDTATGEVAVRLAYETPPAHRPEREASIVFKAAGTEDERLALVTQTEVCLLDRDELVLRTVWSHPLFNDLHHATWFEGRLHVVSTGLDRVLVLDEAGSVAAIRGVLPEAELRPLEPGRDYRRIPSTKPHAAHPNFAFAAEGELWVTRFEQRDAVALDDLERRFAIGAEKPHDGLLHEGSVWFTTVDGHLFAFDVRTRARVAAFDLERELGLDGPLGWCRGLCLADGIAYVGFSRIRYTKTRRNLSWARHGFRATRGYPDRPTRVAAIDLAARRLVGEWDLEPSGLNAVFSVLPR